VDASSFFPSPLFPLHVILRSCARQEPVLIVGDTGCGKTTVCQLLAALLHRPLRIVNCHRNTETADFLGGLRPLRGLSWRAEVAVEGGRGGDKEDGTAKKRDGGDKTVQ